MTWYAVATALWLGLLTAISPCPLAANIAAISFIGKDVASRKIVLFKGLSYSLGRSLTYILVAAVIVWGVSASGDLSRFLQRGGAAFLGPIMILIGMALLGWLAVGANLQAGSHELRMRLARSGIVGAFVLGVLFALSFCSVSAGLYFGALLPLAGKMQSPVLIPALFGLATALPVVVFALLIAFAARLVGSAYDRLRRIERVVQVVFGAGLILAGLYYSLHFTYNLF